MHVLCVKKVTLDKKLANLQRYVKGRLDNGIFLFTNFILVQKCQRCAHHSEKNLKIPTFSRLNHMIPDEMPPDLKELNLTYLEWCAIKPINPLVSCNLFLNKSNLIFICIWYFGYIVDDNCMKNNFLFLCRCISIEGEEALRFFGATLLVNNNLQVIIIFLMHRYVPNLFIFQHLNKKYKNQPMLSLFFHSIFHSQVLYVS